MPALGDQTVIMMGTGSNRQHVYLKALYHALSEIRIQALRGFHAISGGDMTGRIFGKSKIAWWNTFVSASGNVLHALSGLGIDAEPDNSILTGCEEFISHLLSPKKEQCHDSLEFRWYCFRGHDATQSADKLPPSQGAIHEYTRRAHVQSNV